LETIRSLPLPKRITALFDAHCDHAQSVLNRIKLAVISWKDLKERLESIEKCLDLSHRGDQTLAKLIKSRVMGSSLPLTFSRVGGQLIYTLCKTGIFMRLLFYPFDNAADATVFFNPKS
jgi:hypothetical protein